MRLMLRRHPLWHLLSTIIFNFLIYIFSFYFYSIFSILHRLRQFAYYLTIRLNGSVVTNSDILDFFCVYKYSPEDDLL
jgi:hypothetical protein